MSSSENCCCCSMLLLGVAAFVAYNGIPSEKACTAWNLQMDKVEPLFDNALKVARDANEAVRDSLRKSADADDAERVAAIKVDNCVIMKSISGKGNCNAEINNHSKAKVKAAEARSASNSKTRISDAAFGKFEEARRNYDNLNNNRPILCQRTPHRKR